MIFDVYLQLLIDDLKKLWIDVVETYDASRNGTFCMHVTLRWTINDFPTYTTLSDWSAKGCLHILVVWRTHVMSDSSVSKTCIYGASLIFRAGHHFRQDKRLFYGTIEMRDSPKSLKGHEIQEQVHNINNLFRKTTIGRRGVIEGTNWNKHNNIYLSYWKDLLLRHNLDVMHVGRTYLTI